MKSLLSKLDMETFVLDIKQPLVKVPKLGDISVRLTDPMTLEVDLLKSHSLNAVFGLLTEQEVEVLSMRNKANRLEELFVKLVENAQGGQV
jgi:ABC-2 type transport system ATP-binding protein